MADPITKKDRIKRIEHTIDVADPNDGDAARERRVGQDREVVVTIYRRRDNTHFARVLLASVMKSGIIHHTDVELDRYISENDFLKAVAVAGGAIAENLNEKCLDGFDPGYIAKQAMSAAKEMLHDIDAER